MDALGSVSQIYMFALLTLLFVGSGLAAWSFIHFLADKVKKAEAMKKEKQFKLNNDPAKVDGSFKKMIGDIKMANNSWIKLAVFSLVGILISVFALGFVSTASASAMNMTGSNMTGNSMVANSTHQQHQQQGMTTQDNIDVNTQMGNMQMQGGMNGNMGNQMQGTMNGMGQQSGNEYMIMQQQLYQMQMQLNQMQQQQMNNMQMQSGGMNNMQQNSGMGMGMMNMGGSMSSMPQNSSMSNMQQSGNMPQSSGGMGMM